MPANIQSNPRRGLAFIGDLGCRLIALSGYRLLCCECPLSGAKQTLRFRANDSFLKSLTSESHMMGFQVIWSHCPWFGSSGPWWRRTSSTSSTNPYSAEASSREFASTGGRNTPGGFFWFKMTNLINWCSQTTARPWNIASSVRTLLGSVVDWRRLLGDSRLTGLNECTGMFSGLPRELRHNINAFWCSSRKQLGSLPLYRHVQ